MIVFLPSAYSIAINSSAEHRLIKKIQFKEKVALMDFANLYDDCVSSIRFNNRYFRFVDLGARQIGGYQVKTNIDGTRLYTITYRKWEVDYLVNKQDDLLNVEFRELDLRLTESVELSPFFNSEVRAAVLEKQKEELGNYMNQAARCRDEMHAKFKAQIKSMDFLP